MSNPWFRMYSEAVDDEKLRLLSFEDRWHFVALLCCKSARILEDQTPLMRRKVAIKLGLDPSTLEEVARRLAEVDLIDQQTLQPKAWEARQFESDSSKERTRAYRERLKKSCNGDVTLHDRHSDVSVTPQETDTDTDTEITPPKPPAGKPADVVPPGFAAFWATWPSNDRKQAKGKCLDAWKKAHAERDAALVLSHVEHLASSQAWTKENGKFVPAPLSYLNKRSWEGFDEATGPKIISQNPAFAGGI